MNTAQAFREAGRVKRFHANIVTHEQTVAEHSWNMAMLLRALHPEPSEALLWAVLTHDVHERWTGDVPGPAKWWLNDTFHDAVRLLEDSLNKKLGIAFELSEREQDWLRALDILEGWMFALDEIAQGNRHVEHVARAYERVVAERGDRIPAPVRRFMDEYEWRRQPDVI